MLGIALYMMIQVGAKKIMCQKKGRIHLPLQFYCHDSSPAATQRLRDQLLLLHCLYLQGMLYIIGRTFGKCPKFLSKGKKDDLLIGRLSGVDTEERSKC